LQEWYRKKKEEKEKNNGYVLPQRDTKYKNMGETKDFAWWESAWTQRVGAERKRQKSKKRKRQVQGGATCRERNN